MSVNAVRRTRATAKSASTISTVVRVTRMLIASSRMENENVFAMMDTLAMDSAALQLHVEIIMILAYFSHKQNKINSFLCLKPSVNVQKIHIVS